MGQWIFANSRALKIMSEHLPILAIAIPLLVAFVIPILNAINPAVRNVVTLVCLLFVNLIIFLMAWDISVNDTVLYYVLGAASPSQVIPSGLTFPVRIVLKLDGFSAFMAIISGVVTLVAFLYSLKFIKEDGRKSYYTILLLLMLVGMLGMEFTNDLFNFFVFLEILSISSAALVSYCHDSKHPPYAGFKYLLISALATSFWLIGIGFFYAQYGSFNIDYLNTVLGFTLLDKLALVLMVVPLAMKAGAIPMHMWLPDAYSEAPAPITIALVAASQASLYGLFRICFSLFGNPVSEQALNYATLGWIIIVLGVLSMFVGVTMALIQHDVKRLMAYHAVSQTGYMLLGVGVGIVVYMNFDGGEAFASYGRTAMAGGIFHIMNHAFYKGLLFLTSGVLVLRFGSRSLDKMIGLAHRDTFTTVCFIVGALAIAGIPPFNGFASKILLYDSVYQFSPALAVVAMFVSVLTLGSFIKVFYSAFLGPRRDDLLVNTDPLPFSMTLGMGILCILVVLMGIFPDLIVRGLIDPAIAGLVSTR